MDEINTQQNKSMIWDILYKNDIFLSLSDHDIPRIINIIDNIIIDTKKQNSNKNKNLIELNKIIIQDINIQINQYKINNINNRDSTNSTNNKTIKSILKSEIRETMDDRFNNIKNDLDSTINIGKPQEINFKDDISQNNTNLDKDLEELIKKRNNINNNLSLIYDKNIDSKQNIENIYTSTNIPDNMSLNITDNMSSNIPDITSTNISDNTSTNIPNNTSANISDNTSTNIPDNTSTNIPDNTSACNKILDFDNIILNTLDSNNQTNIYDNSINKIKIVQLLTEIKTNQEKILKILNMDI